MNTKLLDNLFTNNNTIQCIFLTDLNALAQEIGTGDNYMCFCSSANEVENYFNSTTHLIDKFTWITCYQKYQDNILIQGILNKQSAVSLNGKRLVDDVGDSEKIAKHVKQLVPVQSAIDITTGNTLDYIDNKLCADIERLKNFGTVKTDFSKLDELSEGIEPDLYTVAAATSLGKTTFCLQIADNIAASGKDVLYFSLEQSKLEIVTKSFSRLLRQNEKEKQTSHITARDIRHGQYPAELQRAKDLYKNAIGNRMNVIEGNFSSTVDDIKNFLDTYIKKTGKTPIVFIDYLQVIQPTTEQARLTTKELMKAIMTTLKQLCICYATAIFVISSLNRAGYLQSVSFESLKESGDIEYTAAVVWGLQFNNIDLKEAKSDDAKRALINAARLGDKEDGHREIKLVCLKNRSGKGTYETEFKYYPDSDLYVQEVKGFNKCYNSPFEGQNIQRYEKKTKQK